MHPTASQTSSFHKNNNTCVENCSVSGFQAHESKPPSIDSSAAFARCELLTSSTKRDETEGAYKNENDEIDIVKKDDNNVIDWTNSNRNRLGSSWVHDVC